MIIGIAGKAGAGKDTAADLLVIRHGFIKVSLADPLKRICRDVFAFTDEQLWGPSEKRNEADARFSRPLVDANPADDPNMTGLPSAARFLTPRHALQQLGTEWGRNCYENVWVDYAVRIADAIAKGSGYDQKAGLVSRPFGGKPFHVAIPDVRFPNELEAIRAAGGRVVRIVRLLTPEEEAKKAEILGLDPTASAHVSETALDGIELDEISNDGTVGDLATALRAWLG